jgi:DNA-binding NarL/FixJ family response regulator
MDPIETLGKCILAVHRGQVWVNSEQMEVILQALIDMKPPRVTNVLGTCLLTKREEQVASLVAEGLTNREIARRLVLSEHTVSNYLFKMYEKLGISSRVEFVLYIFGRKHQTQSTTTLAATGLTENRLAL